MLEIKNILVARDFSPCSDGAIPYALSLAARTGATLHTLYAEVLHADPFAPSQEPATPAEKIRERLKRFAEEGALKRGHFDPGSVRFRHAVVRDIAAAPALLGYAEDKGIDLIVMGTHGRRGVRRFVMGSVAEEVVRLAPCPVLTVGPQKAPADDKPATLGPVLVPVDFSDHARDALRQARALAALYETPITLLHVIEERLHPAFYYSGGFSTVYDVDQNIGERAVAQMKRLYLNAGGAPGDAARFETRLGQPAHTITTFAEEEGLGLIVMPTHGRTGLDRWALGSVTEKVVRVAPCPVLTLKSAGRARAGQAEETEAANAE